MPKRIIITPHVSLNELESHYRRAMDEHRLGLKPVLRRVWVPRGEQPIAKVHWRYQWLSNSPGRPPL